ncbi:MAG: DMT family transporter [Burkholderiales bacterium]
MTVSPQPHRGIFFVIAAVALFAALDTTTKYVSATVTFIMAMWVRYVFQAIIVTATLVPRHGLGPLRSRHPWLQLGRTVLMLSCNLFAFYSFKHMPVGDVTAIIMLAPLLMTVFAATGLNERVSPLRWLLLAGCLAGALVIVRPGAEDFNWAALLPLTLLLCNTLFQVVTSRLARLEDPMVMQYYTSFIGVVCFSVALPFGWLTLHDGTLWLLLLLIAAFSMVGHHLLTLGYATAAVSRLTPYLYWQIAFANLFGWLVFAHVPDRWAMLGILIIAVCGAAGTWLNAREHRAMPGHQALT